MRIRLPRRLRASSAGTRTTATPGGRTDHPAKGGKGSSRSGSPGALPKPVAPECPPGWTIGPPDFVIVGAEKCGTSRWLKLVREHPDVYITKGIREIHYWDGLPEQPITPEVIDGYHRFFPRPPGGVTGEKTPQYMSLWWIPPALAKAAPDARIIMMVRDPVDRYVSGRTHVEQYRAQNVGRGMSDNAYTRRAVETSLHRGQYALQYLWLLDAFPREHVLVLQHERCISSTLEELSRTFEFIGLPPYTPPPELLDREVNPAWMEKVPLSDERREIIRRLYEPEVIRLKELVPDLDLSLWPNYAHLAEQQPVAIGSA
jgi:hypothetical protein